MRGIVTNLLNFNLTKECYRACTYSMYNIILSYTWLSQDIILHKKLGRITCADAEVVIK